MLCRLMHLSRSSFYFWLKALQTPCKQKQKLAETIREIIDLHDKYPSHGYRWLRAKLELDNKIHISDGYALKCCRMAGIQSQAKHRRRKYHGSTDRKYTNVLLAGFHLTAPFQCNPLPASGSFPPFRGTQVFCPSLKGKGDQPYGWWIGSYTDPASNTVCCRLSGVLTPYPLKRVLSPFQGDTMLFPFSAGLGDSSSSSPSRGTQIFVLP
jgi:hypothetical protein